MTFAYFAPLLLAVPAFVALWPSSVRRGDVGIVDLAWGPGFLVQLATAAIVAGAAVSERGWLLLGLIALWSVRLAVVLIGRWRREPHEDPRYRSVRAAWGPAFWWKSLFIVFVLQAVLQWLISLGPISGLLAPESPLGVLAWVGAAVALAGLVLESVADHQLDRFKAGAEPGALMQEGLRAHIRHPNYAGEILFWVGIALICVEAAAWAGVLSPVLIALLVTRVSGAPLIDERLSESRPAYAAYRARVPGFIPRFR